MSRLHWTGGNGFLNAIFLPFTLLLFVMTPIETGSLYAQPTLTDVMKDSPVEEAGDGKDTKVKPGVPYDEFGRGTPRASVREFLRVIGERDFEKAAAHLDRRRLPKEVKQIPGPELARQLRLVLARTMWIDFAALSDDPKGHLEDGLPSYRDRLGRIKSGDKAFDIYLQRVPRGDGAYIWKFSNRTVAQIPELYSIFAHGILEQILPAWLFEFRIFEIYLGEWVAVVAMAVIAYLVAIALTGPMYYWMRRKDTPLPAQLLKHFQKPFRFLVWIVVAGQLLNMMQLTVMAQAILKAKTLTLVVFCWMAMRIIDFGNARMVARLKKRGLPGMAVLLPTLGNALKVVVILGVLIFWLDNIGVRVTTLIAGLGIGGLAVALAAQKSLENVIGAITLYAARPVKVGEFCRFGDKYGTVEEIGLRSTKIRTHDHTIINVPNAEFASIQLENFSVRERMWYHPRIRLRYETTPNQLRYILVEVRKMFYSHPKVLPNPARIRFEGFGEYSLDLETFVFIDANTPDLFLEVAEDLNLRIMDIVAKAGTGIAIPSQAFSIQRGKGLDEAKMRGAEDRVTEWKKTQALFIPAFPQEKIDELQGSLDYPPIGSPGALNRA